MDTKNSAMLRDLALWAHYRARNDEKNRDAWEAVATKLGDTAAEIERLETVDQ